MLENILIVYVTGVIVVLGIMLGYDLDSEKGERMFKGKMFIVYLFGSWFMFGGVIGILLKAMDDIHD